MKARRAFGSKVTTKDGTRHMKKKWCNVKESHKEKRVFIIKDRRSQAGSTNVTEREIHDGGIRPKIHFEPWLPW